MAGALSSLEKTTAAHGEEQRRLADQLATQKQLASKYSDRVSELERENRLRGLELKEAKKELETERSLASKLYNDVRKHTGSTFHREIMQFVSFHVFASEAQKHREHFVSKMSDCCLTCWN